MKKLMSLVLVLALCVTAVAAIAEVVPSKVVGTIEVEAEGITFIPATEEAVAAAATELEILQEKGPKEYFGKEVEAIVAIEAIDEFGPIDVEVGEDVEIGDDGKVEVIFAVNFPYEAGEKVVVLLGTINEDATITWTPYEGEADGNGKVTVRVEPEVLEAADFVAIAIA